MVEELDKGNRRGHQGRKSALLRQSDAVRRSRPLSPTEKLEFSIDPENGTGIVGMLPAPHGTRVQRLDRDGGLIGEPITVAGYLILKSFYTSQEISLWVRPITGLGVVSQPYALIEPE